MKKIMIYTNEKSEITLIDDDDTDLSTYTKQISRIMEMSKICILETTSGTVVLKPSRINCINVLELSLPEVSEIVVTSIQKDVTSKVKNNLDVIKD